MLLQVGGWPVALAVPLSVKARLQLDASLKVMMGVIQVDLEHEMAKEN